MLERLVAGVRRRSRTPWEVARLTSKVAAGCAGAKNLGQWFPFDDAFPWEKEKDTRTEDEKQKAWEEACKMLGAEIEM